MYLGTTEVKAVKGACSVLKTGWRFLNRGYQTYRTLSESKIVPIAKDRSPLVKNIVDVARRNGIINKDSFQLNRFHQVASELSEAGQTNIRILRGWAKSKGWEKVPNPSGKPEMWGNRHHETGEIFINLKIKPVSGARRGLDFGSRIPRFDARLNKGQYINPFTGKMGNSNIGTHIPLE